MPLALLSCGHLPLPFNARLASEGIETLPVKGRAPKTSYSREAFGPSWADTDYNGCDTRNDMLRRMDHIVHDLCNFIPTDRIEVNLRPLGVAHEFGVSQRFG
jgi:hypothetical protein